MINSKELIQLNNEKRKQLTDENLKYYENMLVYIRLSYDKSEQETEEVLSELLNHLLEAQASGRTAKEVFGDNPKQYADEIIGELPKMVTKKRTIYIAMAILYFLAASVFFSGAIDIITYYVFNTGGLTKKFYSGSLALKTIVNIPVAFLLAYVMLQYIRWSSFNKLNKIAELLIFWMYGIISVAIFFAVIYFTPDFGPTVEISVYSILLLGIALFTLAHFTRKAL